MLLVAALLVAGCSGAPPAPQHQPQVALAPPPSEGEQPIRDAELTPGVRFRFPDVLPGRLDVELTGPARPAYAQSGDGFAHLSQDPGQVVDVLTIVPADDVTTFRDPYLSDDELTASDEHAGLLVEPPDDVLSGFTAQPHLEVTAPQHPVTVAGVAAVALDLRVRELPPEAEFCRPPQESQRCASLLDASRFGQYVVEGLRFRLIRVDLPAGRLLVVQNLGTPEAQGLLDSAAFLDHPMPDELSGTRPVPYGDRLLEPGAAYGVELTGLGVGLTLAGPVSPTRSTSTAARLGELPARAVSVRLRPEALAVECAPGLNPQRCGVPLFADVGQLAIVGDGVVRVLETRVRDQPVTIVATDDPAGRALLGSLRFVELSR
jgi:hypothetical protein